MTGATAIQDAPPHVAAAPRAPGASNPPWAELERHSGAVARHAERVAVALGFRPHAADRVRLAGQLHDIGKGEIPSAILHKPGPLEPHERAIMERHPIIGAEMLDWPYFNDIRPWVLHHHEQPDGLGYPYGLHDEEIPLGAKIIAVADVYVAMTSDRIYQRALPAGWAKRELRRVAGTQLDERVVERFLTVTP